MSNKKWKFWVRDNVIPRPVEKRWGNHLNERLKKHDEAASHVYQFGLATFLGYKFGEALKDIREALYNTRHAANTVQEIAMGTQGQKGLNELKERHLEDALQAVSSAATENAEAAKRLQEFRDNRGRFILEMAQTYKGNETVARETSRLIVQLKGAAKNLFEVGNDVKSDWWKENIDSPIILTYGRSLRQLGNAEYKELTDDQIIVKALESSQQVKEFYREARKFYDAREKSEDTIREFTSYLAKVQDAAIADNNKIEQQFPKLVARLKEGYSLEDAIFEVDAKGSKITKQEVDSTADKTASYRERVDETRSEIGTAVPMPAYRDTNWVDVVTNPVVLAATAVLAGNAAMRFLTPGFVYKGFQKIIAAPVRLTTAKLLNGASYFKDAIIPYGKREEEKK